MTKTEKLEQLQEVIEELSMKYDEQSLFRKVKKIVRMKAGLPSAKDSILLMDAEEHLVMDWIRIAFWQHPRILITLSLMLPGDKSCKAFFIDQKSYYIKLHNEVFDRREEGMELGISSEDSSENGKRKKPEELDCDKPLLPERKRAVLGTECKVMITISYSDFVNRWIISKVHLEHNHDLTPESSNLISTHRYIPLRFKKELEFNNEDEGLSSKDNIDMVIFHTTLIKRDFLHTSSLS
jgi:hypothetical protein